MDIVGLAIGVVLLVYFVTTFVIGMCVQARARKMNEVLFGTFPVTQMVFHIIYGLLLGIGLIIGIYEMVWAGLGVYGVKIITISCLRESCAYCHTKNSQGMHDFLQLLRQTPPSISIHIECYHYSTHTDKDGHSHTEKHTTFRQTRYVQLTGWQDNTPPMYIIGSDPLVYLELGQHVELLGNSKAILDGYCTQAYMENRFRDSHCSVTRHIHVPGLTKNNFLKRGEVPGWMNPAVFWVSQFLAFDVMYTCMLRSKTPHTRLQVHKFANLEPNPQFFSLLQQQVPDYVQPPTADLPVFVTEMNQYQRAPQMQINQLPLITDVQPPPFELNFELPKETFQTPQAEQAQQQMPIQAPMQGQLQMQSQQMQMQGPPMQMQSQMQMQGPPMQGQMQGQPTQNYMSGPRMDVQMPGIMPAQQQGQM